jgi:hypothetical protein
MILAERIGAKSCIFVKDEQVSWRATSHCAENTAKIDDLVKSQNSPP